MAIQRRTSLRSVSTAVAVRLRRGYWKRLGPRSQIPARSDVVLLRMHSGLGRSLIRKPTLLLARANRLQPPRVAPMR
jgi:hypothetical protein